MTYRNAQLVFEVVPKLESMVIIEGMLFGLLCKFLAMDIVQNHSSFNYVFECPTNQITTY